MRQYQKRKILPGFSRNLRGLRGHRTQAEFAAFLGLKNQVTYHRYENGRIPRAAVLQDFASRIGITVDEFLSEIPANRLAEIRLGVPSPDGSGERSGAQVKSDEDQASQYEELRATDQALARRYADVSFLDELSDDDLKVCIRHIISQLKQVQGPLEVLYQEMFARAVFEARERIRTRKVRK